MALRPKRSARGSRRLLNQPATISLENLPRSTRLGDLRALLAAHGCRFVRICLETDATGACSGRASVALPSRDAAKAVEVNDTMIAGRPLRVTLGPRPAPAEAPEEHGLGR